MVIPECVIEKCPPIVKVLYRKWVQYMYDRIQFNRPDSPIHAMEHCERVLLFALLIGEQIYGNDPESLTSLAHASIFHDTRRLDDYLDTGHGARASVYYMKFTCNNDDIDYYPEAEYMMRYHDLNDAIGVKSIAKRFGDGSDRVGMLYAIFKDADALDRWRLGRHGLDPRYLRTEPAKSLVDYACQLVSVTVPSDWLKKIEAEVDRTLGL